MEISGETHGVEIGQEKISQITAIVRSSRNSAVIGHTSRSYRTDKTVKSDLNRLMVQVDDT